MVGGGVHTGVAPGAAHVDVGSRAAHIETAKQERIEKQKAGPNPKDVVETTTKHDVLVGDMTHQLKNLDAAKNPVKEAQLKNGLGIADKALSAGRPMSWGESAAAAFSGRRNLVLGAGAALAAGLAYEVGESHDDKRRPT